MLRALLAEAPVVLPAGGGQRRRQLLAAQPAEPPGTSAPADPFRGLDRLTSQLLAGARTPMAMPMDVWQSEDGNHVALDLPGADPGSVEITSERNVLTIRAERRPGHGEAG